MANYKVLCNNCKTFIEKKDVRYYFGRYYCKSEGKCQLNKNLKLNKGVSKS